MILAKKGAHAPPDSSDPPWGNRQDQDSGSASHRTPASAAEEHRADALGIGRLNHDQEMLAPLDSAAEADAAQMLKNREEARAFERSQAPTALLGSAMEIAAHSLSASGSLPPNSAALPRGAPPPPPPPKKIRFLVDYLVAPVPPEISFTFSREHSAQVKLFLCVFSGYEGQAICTSEPGAWNKYVNPGNQSCYFQAKVSDYADVRAAYNACIAWLLKMRVRLSVSVTPHHTHTFRPYTVCECHLPSHPCLPSRRCLCRPSVLCVPP